MGQRKITTFGVYNLGGIMEIVINVQNVTILLDTNNL